MLYEVITADLDGESSDWLPAEIALDRKGYVLIV